MKHKGVFYCVNCAQHMEPHPVRLHAATLRREKCKRCGKMSYGYFHEKLKDGTDAH